MMTKTNKDLEKMKLSELQATFTELIGEKTRCPNRTFLIRRITEAIASKHPTTASDREVRETIEGASVAVPETAVTSPTTAGTDAKPIALQPKDEHPASSIAPRLSELDVPALQARYHEIVGRTTASVNRSYLLWKIREAEKGRVSIGPSQSRRGKGATIQVLPLRLEAELVGQLDDAWRRLGLRSRMDLFRRSLQTYLASAGESELAELIANDD